MQHLDSQEEERLRRENQDLKRQIQQLKGPAHGPPKLWQPSSITIWSIFLAVAVLIVVAFFAGYVPLVKRQALIATEAHEQEVALPRVEVIVVGRAAGSSEFELPGNIQATKSECTTDDTFQHESALFGQVIDDYTLQVLTG